MMMTTENDNSIPKPAWIVPIESRKERADYYFQSVLEGQQQWYSNNAAKHKRRYWAYAILVIIFGALISVLQVMDPASWTRWFTAALGAMVALVRAVDTLLRPGESWNAYRKVAESMKREYRLYLNNADLYTHAADEAAAYRLLVERVETAIAEEQQLFWQFHSKGGGQSQAPRAPAGTE